MKLFLIVSFPTMAPLTDVIKMHSTFDDTIGIAMGMPIELRITSICNYRAYKVFKSPIPSKRLYSDMACSYIEQKSPMR